MGIFSRSYHAALCISALNADEIELARRHYEKIDLGKLSNPRLIALGARISLLENDTPMARSQLGKALRLAEAKTSQDARYVAHYCRYFLELIERSDRHASERLQALALTPSQRILTALPLPQREVTLAEVEQLNMDRKKSTTH